MLKDADVLNMILNHLKHEHFIIKNLNQSNHLPNHITMFINLQLVLADNSSIICFLNH